MPLRHSALGSRCWPQVRCGRAIAFLSRPGDRIKTDPRDAVKLARLHRAGELTSVWIPDRAHEAMRDLVRARLAAACSLRHARQQLSGFLLRHGHHYHLAIVTRADSYRGIHTFIRVHLKRLDRAFGLGWKKPPAHTSIRSILSGLDGAHVEAAFRSHAADLGAARPLGQDQCRVVAIDGKVLRGSFDAFHDGSARLFLSAFAAETALTIAHIEIDEKSNEIPAAQQLLAELDLAGRIVTLDAIHCQKNICDRQGKGGT